MSQVEFDSKLRSSTVLDELIQSAIQSAVQPLQQQVHALQQQLQQYQQAPQPYSNLHGSDNLLNKLSSDMSSMSVDTAPLISVRRPSMQRSPLALNHTRAQSSTDSHVSLAGNAEGDNVDNIADVDPRTLLSNRLKNRVTTQDSTNENTPSGQRKLGLGSGTVVAGHAIHQLGVSGNSRQRGSNSAGPELILVEDVRVSARIANAALTRAHYKVVVASDGESAVEQYKQNINTVRVILMDINLPGISGIEATERIRRYEQEVGAPPVLIFGLTGNVEEENLRSYQAVGMNGCIMKGKLLVEAVQQAMQISERNPNEFVNLANQKFVAENKSVDDASPVSSKPIHDILTNVQSPVRSTDALYTTPQQHPTVTAARSPPTQTTTLSAGPALNLTRSVSAGNGPELLLVEDVRVSARIAQQALQRAHYRVDVANDGESAVDKFKAHSNTIKIILMDINLPGISGIEATEQIRKHQRTTAPSEPPVLIFGLTGNVEEENLRLYESAGMNGCILKGKLLADAVKQGVTEVSRNPSQFVKLASQNVSPHSATSTIRDRPSSATQQQSNEQPIVSPPSNTPSVSSTRTPSYNAAQAVREREEDSSNASAIGTPRATQPRQLLNNKFQGRGVNKPGIGLGSGTGSTNSAGTSPQQQSVTNGPELLLVEDVRVSQRIAQQALQRAHYKVVVASDGESAVEQFTSYWSTMRIILMDINLPGISGVEATEKIRRYEETLSLQHNNYRPVLIFGLTGNVDSDSLHAYEQAGMNGCIMKGQVLVDSIKEAERQTMLQPNTFVNLVSGS